MFFIHDNGLNEYRKNMLSKRKCRDDDSFVSSKKQKVIDKIEPFGHANRLELKRQLETILLCLPIELVNLIASYHEPIVTGMEYENDLACDPHKNYNYSISQIIEYKDEVFVLYNDEECGTVVVMDHCGKQKRLWKYMGFMHMHVHNDEIFIWHDDINDGDNSIIVSDLHGFEKRRIKLDCLHDEDNDEDDEIEDILVFDDVIIVDTSEEKIKVVNKEGKLQYEFGCMEPGTYRMEKMDNNIIVYYFTSGNLVLYDIRGVIMKTIKTKINGNAKLCIQDNHICLLRGYNRRISVNFEIYHVDGRLLVEKYIHCDNDHLVHAFIGNKLWVPIKDKDEDDVNNLVIMVYNCTFGDHLKNTSNKIM